MVINHLLQTIENGAAPDGEDSIDAEDFNGE